MQSGDGPQNSFAVTRSLSLRRYVSDDMSSVGLDSPRRAKSNSWPNSNGSDVDEGGLAAGCSTFLGPFTNPVIGGETFFQLTTSWCVANDVLLAWRFIMFLYMLGTTLYLASRGSLVAFSISAEIYVLTLIGSTLGLFPHFAGRNGRGCCGGGVLPRTNSAFGRAPRSPSEHDGVQCFASFQQFMLTSVTLVVQSASGLAAFWDALYWYKLRNQAPSASSVDLLLLHTYNVMPVFTEVIFSRLEFRLVYFTPGIFFLASFFGMIASGSVRTTSSDWLTSQFNQNTPWTTWGNLMLSYICASLAVFGIQRARSSFEKHLAGSDGELGSGRRGRSRMARHRSKLDALEGSDFSPPRGLPASSRSS